MADGFVVQTLIFPKAKWNSLEDCKRWARDHDYETGDVDETEDSWRMRQEAPEKFTRLRTICIDPADAPLDDSKVKAVGGPMRSASSDEEARAAYPHVAARLFDTPLLVGRAKLEVLVAALGPRLLGIAGSPPPTTLLAGAPEFEAPAVRGGGIGVIPICGTLVHQAFAVKDAPSGMTTYAAIRRSFDAFMEDPAVAAVALDIDSHGGEVDGCLDLVEHIYAARGRKPIYALVDHTAVSAGYAIASAADRIYVPADGHVGSIGVCAVHVDHSKANEQAGLKISTFYVGERKNDLNPNEPISDEARAGLMGELEAAYDRFVRIVARNRGVNEEAVRETEAAIYCGERATAIGLADVVSPVAGALADIAAAVKAPAPAALRPAAQASAHRPGAEVIDLDSARREAYDRGRREALAADDARRAEIEEIGRTLARTAGPNVAALAGRLAAEGLRVEAARAILFEIVAMGSGPEISPLHPKPGDGTRLPPSLALDDIFARRRRDVETQRKGG